MSAPVKNVGEPDQNKSGGDTTTASPTTTTTASAKHNRGQIQQQNMPLTMRAAGVEGKPDLQWSAWYSEADDNFTEFASFDPNFGAAPALASSSLRTLSARQMSGQFEDDVEKSWENDWEDEDLDDTFDAVMAKVAKAQAQEQSK